jgi:hypothetical protein
MAGWVNEAGPSRRSFLGAAAGAVASPALGAPGPIPDGPKIDQIDAWLREQAQAAEAAGNSKLIEQYKWQCERIIGFTEYRFPRYRPSRHHRMIAEQLERVERGEIDRLMIRVPPRHGKSELAAKILSSLLHRTQAVAAVHPRVRVG